MRLLSRGYISFEKNYSVLSSLYRKEWTLLKQRRNFERSVDFFWKVVVNEPANLKIALWTLLPIMPWSRHICEQWQTIKLLEHNTLALSELNYQTATTASRCLEKKDPRTRTAVALQLVRHLHKFIEKYYSHWKNFALCNDLFQHALSTNLYGSLSFWRCREISSTGVVQAPQKVPW